MLRTVVCNLQRASFQSELSDDQTAHESAPPLILQAQIDTRRIDQPVKYAVRRSPLNIPRAGVAGTWGLRRVGSKQENAIVSTLCRCVQCHIRCRRHFEGPAVDVKNYSVLSRSSGSVP